LSSEENQQASKEPASISKTSGLNIWAIATVILAIGLIASITFILTMPKSPTALVTATGNADKQALANKALNYLKTNIFDAQGVTITLKDTEQVNDSLLLVNFELSKDSQTQTLTAYLTTDGKKLIAGQTLDLDTPLPQAETTPEEPAATIAKTDKPEVQLFVMSYCPYGNQAEAGIIPALKLLGNTVDFKLRYIVGKQGSDYTSLHGAEELVQDVRELCIQKYMPDKFLDYISAVNTACTLDNISTCWKTEAEKLKLDTAKIETCASAEKTALLDAEIAASENYNVSGSPTLIINDGQYSGGRSANEFKAGICSAFNTPPADCDKNLSSTGTAASGGCAT